MAAVSHLTHNIFTQHRKSNCSHSAHPSYLSERKKKKSDFNTVSSENQITSNRRTPKCRFSYTGKKKGLNLNQINQQKHVILTTSTLVNLEQVNLMGFQTESNWLKSSGEIEPEKTETTKLQQHWYDISRWLRLFTWRLYPGICHKASPTGQHLRPF